MTTSTPEPDPTPPRLSPLVGASGGALVVLLIGGIIGGVLATQPRPATPAAEVVVTPEASAPATVAAAAPDLTPVATATPAPTPSATPTPEVTPAAPTPTVAPSPTPPAQPSTQQPPPGSQVDPTWLRDVSAATGVPLRAMQAYAAAALTLQRERASCSLGWNTLAAIGQIESQHGSFGGAVLGADGVARPRIIGPALNGEGFAAIPDTDGGVHDGDTTWDRAVGPMQFIPSTWKASGADGNGDGVKDPHNLDDAALAAGRYLCASGGMDSAGGWRNAVIGYNRSEQYIADVARIANQYAMDAPR